MRQNTRADGAVAQLGERIVRNDKVRGSIPLCSTSYLSGLLPDSPLTASETYIFRLEPSNSVHKGPVQSQGQDPLICLKLPGLRDSNLRTDGGDDGQPVLADGRADDAASTFLPEATASRGLMAVGF